MSILVINAGSTSVKYKLFTDDEQEIKQGCFEHIASQAQALKQILREIGNLNEIKAVGHRVVHGGNKFSRAVVIDETVTTELEEFNELASLHNPFNIAAIKIWREYLPQVPQIAVFDTAFYADLPETSRLYAVPGELAKKYNLYRCGFHGISHKFAAEEAAAKLKIPISKINLISCHLGGGWSITAIKQGRPIDTSMGLTPLEGLVMMSRCGDIDPGLILKLLKVLPGEINQDKVARLDDLLNNQSGIKGLTGLTDFKELLARVSLGDSRAVSAFALAIHRLIKYIGAYWLLLAGKVDAIIFTGGIGAGNPYTRDQVIKRIKCLGKVPCLAIKTNEELMIMREVRKLAIKK